MPVKNSPRITFLRLAPVAVREYFNPNSSGWHRNCSYKRGICRLIKIFYISIFSNYFWRALISGDYVRDVWPESSERWNLTREIRTGWSQRCEGIISALDLLSALVSSCQPVNKWRCSPGAGAGTKISWIRLMAGPFGWVPATLDISVPSPAKQRSPDLIIITLHNIYTEAKINSRGRSVCWKVMMVYKYKEREDLMGNVETEVGRAMAPPSCKLKDCLSRPGLCQSGRDLQLLASLSS